MKNLNTTLTSHKKARTVANIITILYMGTGTIKFLALLINPFSVFSFGEPIESLLLPSYFLAFLISITGAGYPAGVLVQLISIAIVYLLLFFLFKMFFYLINRRI